MEEFSDTSTNYRDEPTATLQSVSDDYVDYTKVKKCPKLDYEKVITRDDLDMDNYNMKFKAWDFIMRQGLLAKNDPHAWAMLNDPTVYSYQFFQIINERLELFAYQDLIVNDEYKRILFTSSNQNGKSLGLNVLSAFRLLTGKNVNIAIVSKSLDQSKFQMSRIRQLLNQSKLHWKEETGESESIRLITHEENGVVNRLICCPCTEGLLGYDLDYLFLDEFEFWEVDLKYFFEQIAQPRTYSTKGQIIIFSNPNGQGYGMELENQKLQKSGKHKWHRYNFNYLDKPGNTKEEYDQLEYELPRQQFESTVAAIRSMSDRCYFTADEIAKSYDPQLQNMKDHIVDKYTYWALDVGSKHDQACLVGCYVEPDTEEKFNHIYIFNIHLYPVGYPLSRVAGVNVDESDGWHYEKSVREYLEEYKIHNSWPVFGYDATGNAGMKPLFDAMNIPATDIIFSGPEKSAMYQRFKYFMEKGLLHRIQHKDFEKQCSELIVTKSKRGYLLINAASQVDKSGKKEDRALKRIADDVCDSVTAVISLADPMYNEPSMMVL